MRHIGVEHKRIIADQIVTGKAVYTADLRKPNMKYGRVLRSPYAYAEILSIDASEAEAMDGVYAVVTYQDVGPDVYITNGFTPPAHSHPLDKIVRYIGDAVALVVADSEDLADEAMEKIHVEYRPMKPVLTMDEAMAPDAPQIYPNLPGNIAPAKQNINFTAGNLEEGFAEADEIVEVNVALRSGQNPLPVEPPTVLTYWDGDFLNVEGSIAAIAYCQQNVAASLNIPYENIRTIAPCVGGSFGSKLFSGNVQPVVYSALMSKKAGYPVLYTYTKEEHFAAHQNRMHTQGHVKLGVKRDGRATAVVVDQLADAGYCASTQEFMLCVGTHTLTMLCRTDNKQYNSKVIITNKMASGSFRGYGYLESTILISQAIMEACIKLNLDPVEYYKRNALRHGDAFYNAASPMHPWQNSTGPNWDEMLEETAKAWHWREKFKGWGVPTWQSEDGRFVRGVGIGCAGHVDVGGKQSNTNVILTGMGGVIVQTCMVEFGAGVRDVYQKIVAEALDMPLERVKIAPADTMVAPPDFGSTGSRSTYTGGISALYAAQDVRKKVLERASERLNIPVADLGFKNCMIYRLSNPDEKYPLAPRIMGKVDSLTGVGHFGGVENAPIFHTQMVEIEVDKKLGTFEVVDHFGGSDAGTIINPRALYNQVTSFFPGIDIACYEESVMDPRNNRLLNPSMIDYKTRTFNMAPHHDHVVLESFKNKDSAYPYGAFGVGEPLLAPGAPAIQMAFYNACGIRLKSFPFLPSEVLRALKEKEAN